MEDELDVLSIFSPFLKNLKGIVEKKIELVGAHYLLIVFSHEMVVEDQIINKLDR